MPFTLDQLQEGQILLIDKPLHWTSFDVVNKIRYSLLRAYGIRKLKVGHAGTLDPLASGLLVICTGKFTRKIEQLQAADKRYTGTLKLGATTPSFDLETQIDKEFPLNHLEDQQLQMAAKHLSGEQFQVPPSFSAKRVDGKRAYESARKGINVIVPARRVWIHHFILTKIGIPEVDFDIHCSKGTYIRSLVRDFGLFLNNGAHLINLRRISSGSFQLKDALTLEEFLKSLPAAPNKPAL